MSIIKKEHVISLIHKTYTNHYLLRHRKPPNPRTSTNNPLHLTSSPTKTKPGTAPSLYQRTIIKPQQNNFFSCRLNDFSKKLYHSIYSGCNVLPIDLSMYNFIYVYINMNRKNLCMYVCNDIDTDKDI